MSCNKCLKYKAAMKNPLACVLLFSENIENIFIYKDIEFMAQEAGGGAEKPTTPVKLILIMVVGAILLVAVSMGGVFFLLNSMGMLDGGGSGAGGGGGVSAQFDDRPALYHAFEEPFIVNFKERGRTRFLQVSIQVMTREADILVALETHLPLIRNNLLLLLSSQKSEEFHTPEGRESLRQAALLEVQKILEEQTGERETIEGLYFTSFVTQ